MKGTYLLTMLLAVIIPRSAGAGEIDRVINALANCRDYHAEATVSVQLPQGDDVNYRINLWSTVSPADTLAPCSYLIEWELPDRDNLNTGFTSYADGHMFRHSGTRLQEYHFDWDSIPFLTGGAHAGVQRQAQFTNLLPQFIAGQLAEITSDNGWEFTFTPDTMNMGRKAAVIQASLTVNGVVGRKATYIFDPVTFMPRSIETENNPATISEQVLVTRYTDTGSEPFPGIAEADLAERYRDVFDNYRESNFSVETLRGKPLPSFSLPTTTGERYTYQKGDPLRAATVIAMLDLSTASNAETVKALRNAAAMLPQATDLIFAFADTDINGAETATGQILEGEHLLTSARGMARSCGVTSFPTLIIAGRDGIIRDTIIGFNKNLSTVVIEKTTLANQ